MSKGIMALLSPIYLAVVPVFMTDAITVHHVASLAEGGMSIAAGLL